MGGFIGTIVSSSSISDSYTEADVTESGSAAEYIGGFVGNSGNSGSSCKISRCHADGFVYSKNSSNGYIGGFVGYHCYGSRITESYSTGEVKGIANEYVGGFIGMNDNSKATNCYSRSNVSISASYIGGLIGYLHNYSTVTDCYSTGKISSTTAYANGLVGSRNYSTITACFYDKTNSTKSDTSSGTPKTTAEMKNVDTFSSSSWDFTDIWTIDEEGLINDGYPYLLNNLSD